MSIRLILAGANALGLDRLDAQLLLLQALAKPASERAWLLAHDLDVLSDSVNDAFMALAQRRLRGEPVAYLTGHKEFFGLDLHVDARVLVPRPDTETLVDWALDVLDALDAQDGFGAPAAGYELFTSPGSPCQSARSSIEVSSRRALDARRCSVLDLGTGSGAVALAIKHSRPGAAVSAMDFSADALAVAQANAQRLRLDVQFSQGSWLEVQNAQHAQHAVWGRHHLIVSNPPYIAAADPHLGALTHEPLQALASGPDGLDDIRAIIRRAPAHLHPGGWLLLEHGYDQAARVCDMLCSAGFADVQSRRDLGRIERCSGGRWPEISDPTMG